MSSLAAAKADNFYYPPEWDPSKGNLDKVHTVKGETLPARLEFRLSFMALMLWAFGPRGSKRKAFLLYGTARGDGRVAEWKCEQV